MLLHATAYHQGAKVAELAPPDIAAWLARDEGFIWVALVDPEPQELTVFAPLFNLHELAVEDALKGRQRPKIEEYGDDLFIVLRVLDPPESDDAPYNVGQVSIFAGKNYVLTVRRDNHHSLATVRQRCEREPALLALGPGFVFYAILDAIVDGYFPLLEELEEALETLEDNVFQGRQPRENLQAFYDTKQKLLAAKHAIAPLMDALARLHSGRVPPLCAPVLNYLRDVHDHLVRLNVSLENTREMLQTTLQVSLTLVGLSENENTKKLAAWAAMIALPTLIAGIYGMNFDSLPGLHWQWSTIVCIAVMAALDVVLYLQFKRAGWL